MSEANFQSKDLGMPMSLEDFGAVPHDDTEWVQKQVDAGLSLPPGTFRIGKPIRVRAEGIIKDDVVYFPAGNYRFINGNWVRDEELPPEPTHVIG